jgi:starvation-inducible outer membrane lipoprotein
MKLLIVALTLSLSACVSVPVERKFPKAPEELMTSCPDLQTIPAGTTQLSVVVEAVTTNYGQYQMCQTKNDTWIDWYNRQKEIFDSVK